MGNHDEAQDGSLIRASSERSLVARSAGLAKRGLESLQSLDRTRDENLAQSAMSRLAKAMKPIIESNLTRAEKLKRTMDAIAEAKSSSNQPSSSTSGIENVLPKDVPAIDEAKYAKAKPALDEALSAFEGETPEAQVNGLIDHLMGQGVSLDKISEMQPYIVRFLEEESVVSTEKEKTDEPAFDQQRYEKVKPALAEAFATLAETDRQEQMTAFLRKLNEKTAIDTIRQLKPYVVKFFKENVLQSQPPSTEKEKTHGEDFEPHSLFSELDENVTDSERMTIEQMKDMVFTPISELLQTAKMERRGPVLKMNVASHELVRKVMEEVRIQAAEKAGKKLNPDDYTDLFAGLHLDPAILQAIVRVFREKADEAKRNDYPAPLIKTLTDHADMLEAAAAEGHGTAVTYILDRALPHELFHLKDYIGAIEKSLLNRHSEASKTKLDAHKVREILWEKHYKKYNEYKRIDSQKYLDANLRANIPNYLFGHSEKELRAMSITQEMKNDYLLIWFGGYAEKNGITKLDNFDSDEIGARNYTEQVRAAYQRALRNDDDEGVVG